MHATENPRAQHLLRRGENPFTSGESSHRPGRTLQIALGEILAHIGAGTPVVVVRGNAGAGKSLLLDMTFRVCSKMGLSVLRIDQADLLQLCLREQSDVLFVDRAESFPTSALRQFLLGDHKSAAVTTVFFWRSGSGSRFTDIPGEVTIVELRGVSDSDAQAYVMERAASIGRPDLFASDALELVTHNSRGSLNRTRSIANLAFLAATMDDSSQIQLKHVAHVLTSQHLPELAQAPPAPQNLPPDPKAEFVRENTSTLDPPSSAELVVENLRRLNRPRRFTWRTSWSSLRLWSLRDVRSRKAVTPRLSFDQRPNALLSRALIGVSAFLTFVSFVGLVSQVISNNPLALNRNSLAARPVLAPQVFIGAASAAPALSPRTPSYETANTNPGTGTSAERNQALTRPSAMSTGVIGLKKGPTTVTSSSSQEARGSGQGTRERAPEAAQRSATTTGAQMRGAQDQNPQKPLSAKAGTNKAAAKQGKALQRVLADR